MFLISQDRREIFITEGANRSTFHILLPIHSGKSGLKARVRAVGGPLPRGAPPASAPARPPSPTHLSGWFGRVVCDEGHAAKTIRTRVRQSVARLEAEHVWFFTATPLYNQAFNLCGYLAIFYSGLRRAGVMQEGGDNSKVNWFPEYKQLADQAMLPSRSPDDGVGMFTETIIWVALEKAVASRHAAMKTLLDHMENKAGNGCVPIVTPASSFIAMIYDTASNRNRHLPRLQKYDLRHLCQSTLQWCAKIIVQNSPCCSSAAGLRMGRVTLAPLEEVSWFMGEWDPGWPWWTGLA